MVVEKYLGTIDASIRFVWLGKNRFPPLARPLFQEGVFRFDGQFHSSTVQNLSKKLHIDFHHRCFHHRFRCQGGQWSKHLWQQVVFPSGVFIWSTHSRGKGTKERRTTSVRLHILYCRTFTETFLHLKTYNIKKGNVRTFFRIVRLYGEYQCSGNFSCTNSGTCCMRNWNSSKGSQLLFLQTGLSSGHRSGGIQGWHNFFLLLYIGLSKGHHKRWHSDVIAL